MEIIISHFYRGLFLCHCCFFPAFAQDLQPVREVEVRRHLWRRQLQAAASWAAADDLKASILTKLAPTDDDAAW